MKGRYDVFLFLLAITAVDPIAFEWVSIPSGSYYMGALPTDYGWYADEQRHFVAVDSFEMMSMEVSQYLWLGIMGTTVEDQRDLAAPSWPLVGVGENMPMYYVTWHECQDFIDILNSLDSTYCYRLPTEAEWEYACRAGTTTAYYWGESTSASDADRSPCWYSNNSDGRVHEIGSLEPNAWGLYDMSGNVWEWCSDTYNRDESLYPVTGYPPYEGSDSEKVIRGGSWYSEELTFCRSSMRMSMEPSSRRPDLGFRLVRTPIAN